MLMLSEDGLEGEGENEEVEQQQQQEEGNEQRVCWLQ